jgi:hypothetical protein
VPFGVTLPAIRDAASAEPSGTLLTVTDQLERLQSWYAARCDGDWEHEFGVEIGTLDNPGWRLRIDLAGTPLQGSVFERRVVERSPADWLQLWVEDDAFHAACGPHNLTEVLAAFDAFAS